MYELYDRQMSAVDKRTTDMKKLLWFLVNYGTLQRKIKDV